MMTVMAPAPRSVLGGHRSHPRCRSPTTIAPSRRRMSRSDVDRASTAMTSEAAVMSKPDWRGTPSWAVPSPRTMLRSARSLTSRTRRHEMLWRSRLELVAVVEVVVDDGRQRVVGGRHRVHVAGQVEVERLERRGLAVAAAGRSALDAEGRTHRRLPDGGGGPLADVGHPLGEADGRRRLALAERGGGDGGDHDVAGPGPVGQCVDGVEGDLGHVAAVGLEEVLVDPHGCGHVGDREERGRAGDLEGGQLRRGHRVTSGLWWAGTGCGEPDCTATRRDSVRPGVPLVDAEQAPPPGALRCGRD